MSEQTRDPRSYQIIGAAMEVHRELGPGFLEAVYQEALAIEFELRNIPYESEVVLPLEYKGRVLKTKYKADFVCFNWAIILETKALKEFTPNEESQLINYLKATKIEVGLLINFGAKSLEFKRYIWTQDHYKSV